MERLTVTLGECSYPITIAAGLFNDPASFLPLKSDDQAMLVANETLAPFYLDTVRSVLEQAGVNADNVTLPDGRQYKSLVVMDTVFTALLQKPCNRDTTLVAFGGGVIGDLTGSAAASYQYGVRLIQVPTTLLSQVDSSVDGKTAASHPLDKSMVGAPWQSVSVVVDLNRLKTPSARELTSGLAKIIRYDVIPDGEFLSWLENNTDTLLVLDEKVMAYCIRRCCELRTEVVTVDERETGLCALLNLGHTSGRAIEAEMGHGNWLHGEAVVAGIVMAAHTSERLGQFHAQGTRHTIDLLKRAGLSIRGLQEMSAQVYLPHMMRGGKVLVGDTQLVPPPAIGSSELHGGVPHDVVLGAITDTQQAQQQEGLATFVRRHHFG